MPRVKRAESRSKLVQLNSGASRLSGARELLSASMMSRCRPRSIQPDAAVLYLADRQGGDLLSRPPRVGGGQEVLDGFYGLLILEQWCVALVRDRN